MAERKRDPIRKVELADGRIRWRTVVDVGTKVKVNRATGKPVLDRDGRPVTMRDQRTHHPRRCTPILGEGKRPIGRDRQQGDTVRRLRGRLLEPRRHHQPLAGLMPPLNRCTVRRGHWPHVRCTGHGWPSMHRPPHRWFGLLRWRVR